MSGTLPEPARDARAQVAAVADPRNPKHTAFLAAGTKMPAMMPSHLHTVHRPEGTLVTSVPAHAHAFATAPRITNGLMQQMMGYPEHKSEAVRSGAPQVVQGVNKRGDVMHEMMASPAGVPAAARQATDIAGPMGGKARVVSVASALQRRMRGLLG
jgi:hypothetical protein